MVTTAAVSFFILILASCFIEYSRLQSTAKVVRDAVQAAATETCAEQYADLYGGVREGYSGGYKLDGGDWSESLSTADIYARLDTSLGTKGNGPAHIKYAGSDINYKLSGLSVEITNAPFAPGRNIAGQLTCIAQVNIDMPFMVHLWDMTPLHATINVKSGYLPKF
jgi:hypothetical protein